MAWDEIKTAIHQSGFLPKVIGFDSRTLAAQPRLRERLTTEYINSESYKYEEINRASRACGPLVKWVISQVCSGK